MAEKLFRTSWSDIQAGCIDSENIAGVADAETSQPLTMEAFDQNRGDSEGLLLGSDGSFVFSGNQRVGCLGIQGCHKKKQKHLKNKSNSSSSQILLSGKQVGSETEAAAESSRHLDTLDKGSTAEKYGRSHQFAGSTGFSGKDLNLDEKGTSRLVASRLKSFVETEAEASSSEENLGARIASRIKELAGRFKTETDTSSSEKTTSKIMTQGASEKTISKNVGRRPHLRRRF